MYSDILFNGSRRFVVPVSQTEITTGGERARVYLEHLKEEGATADAVKYVLAQGDRAGRQAHVANDAVWGDRSTYLKAVVEPLEDADDDEDLHHARGRADGALREVLEKQTKLGEPVRCIENLIDSSRRASDWAVLWRLWWQSLLQSRLSAKESELSNDIQQLLRNYLKQQGQDMQAKVTVQFDALPADIRAEFTRLQQTYREESMAMVGQNISTVRAPRQRCTPSASTCSGTCSRRRRSGCRRRWRCRACSAGRTRKQTTIPPRRRRERGRSQQTGGEA